MKRVTLADAIRAPEPPRHGPNDPPKVSAATLTVPVPPSANRWHRNYRGQRKPVRSDEAKAYVANLGLILHAQGWRGEPFTGDVRVEIRWYRARKSGDTDKRGAILCDALEKLVYVNDNQIADYRIVRDDSQPKQARMVVTITPMGEP